MSCSNPLIFLDRLKKYDKDVAIADIEQSLNPCFYWVWHPGMQSAMLRLVGRQAREKNHVREKRHFRSGWLLC